MESLTIIMLGGLGGAIIAPLITLAYDKYKHHKKVKNLFKGFISEMEINREYLKHNFTLAKKLEETIEKPGVFIPVRNYVCSNILTSGEIKLDRDFRSLCDHYLVTLDHLNQMIKTMEQIDNKDREYHSSLERIKRYCRKDLMDYGEPYDFVWKYIDKIKDTLVKQKDYLKKVS